MAKPKYIIVLEGQSVWDLALQEYGSPEGVGQLMIDNPGLLDFENSPVAGTKILIDETKVIDKDNVLVFKQSNSKPANGITNEELQVAFTSGFSMGFN
jgi:hypothetical protein